MRWDSPPESVAALLADGLRHVTVELGVDGLQVLFAGAALLAPTPFVFVEPPLQVGQHPLEPALEAVLAPALLEGELDLLARRSVEQQRARTAGQLVPGGVLIDLEAGRDRVEDLPEEDVVPPLPGLDGPFFDRQLFVLSLI